MKLTLPKLGNSKSSFRYGEQLNPGRDWLVLATIAGLLLVASIGWNVWLFYRVTNGDAIGNATVSKPINPASIDSVNALFQKRAEIETQYKNSHFADPSVPATAPQAPAGTPGR